MRMTITDCNFHFRQKLFSIILYNSFYFHSFIPFNIAILEYARIMKIQNLVLHFHTRIDFWAAHWGLSDTQKRNMYQKMSDILSMSDKNSLALNFLIKFFGTYHGVSSYPEDVKEIAVKAVVSAINSSVSSYADRNRLLEVIITIILITRLGSYYDHIHNKKIMCDLFQSFVNFNKSIKISVANND